MEPVDLIVLVVRIWVGIVFIAHGFNHARSLEGTARWFEKVGFSSPRLNARLSAYNEIAIGLALLVGLLTPIAAAGAAATMFVAFWSIHRFAGFFVFHRPDEGWEYVASVSVLSLAIAVLGPGSLSVDALWGIEEAMDGWVGAVIVGGGILVAAGQLAVFWRKPQEEQQT